MRHDGRERWQCVACSMDRLHSKCRDPLGCPLMWRPIRLDESPYGDDDDDEGVDDEMGRR